MVKNSLHHCECSECAERGEEIVRLERLLDPPSDVSKLREIMQDCLSAAQAYRKFNRPVDPASVVAIYERIAASIAFALV